MKKWKVCLLALGLLLLCGCGARNDVSYHVYLITKSTQTEFWKSVFAGATAAKAEYNVDLTILGPEREEEYDVQNAYIRQAVADGADAIVFSAISYTGNAPAINEAVEAGVKVVVIDSDVDAKGVTVRIGTDNVEAGRISAAAALEGDEEQLVVGIVNCYAETQNCREREQGFREVLRTDTRVQEIYTVNVATDADVAQQAALALMEEHPEINVLIGFNEPLAVGAAMAVDALGLGGKIQMIAFDTNIHCIEYLQAGVVTTLIAQNPYAMGYLGVEKAWETLQGAKFPSHTIIDTATTCVTQENMFSMECQKVLFSFN